MNKAKKLSKVIPIDWKIESLDQLTDTIFVGTDPAGGKDSHSVFKTGYRIIQSAPVFDGFIDISKVGYIDKKTFESLSSVALNENDVLLNQLGNGVTFARSCVAQDNILPAVITRSVGCIRCDPDKLDPWFLNAYLVLSSTKKYIESFDSGSSRRAIDGSKMRQLLIPHPKEIQEQINIGNFYKTILDKISLNNRINQELEAMAKLIYDYWFVQFDFPISAERAATMGKPDLKGKPYKSSGGKMVYNEKLKRQIPDVWEVKELEEILDTELGGTPSTKVDEYWNGDIPWLNSGEVANFPILDSEERITEEAINNSATALMPAGTCVISITRHLRPSILAVPACANQSVVGIYESDKLKSSYIYPYLKNEIPRLMSLRTGAQQPHINKGTLDESIIIEPHEDVLENYYHKVSACYDQIINNAKQNQQLASLRDWLLPMLMNGQVTVGEAEEKLSMSAEEGGEYG